MTSLCSAMTTTTYGKWSLKYSMQDLGELKQYLGLVLDRVNGDLILHQAPYAKTVVKRFQHLIPTKSKRKCSTPLPPGIKLTKESKSGETAGQRDYADRFPYQSVGYCSK